MRRGKNDVATAVITCINASTKKTPQNGATHKVKKTIACVTKEELSRHVEKTVVIAVRSRGLTMRIKGIFPKISIDAAPTAPVTQKMTPIG